MKKKVKNVLRVRDISIKKGLAKSKIKKINMSSTKQGPRSNDTSPAKKQTFIQSKYKYLNGILDSGFAFSDDFLYPLIKIITIF